VRFELSYYALSPISRSSRPGGSGISFQPHQAAGVAEAHQIPIAKNKRGEAPFSVDAHLLHSSSEERCSKTRAVEADAIVYQRTLSPEEAPIRRFISKSGFEKGMRFRLGAMALSPRLCSPP